MTAVGTTCTELLSKQRNEMTLAFSRDVERSGTRPDHVAMILMSEIHTDDLEAATVQLWLAAQVRDEQCVDHCAPMALQVEKVLICHYFRTTRKLCL